MNAHGTKSERIAELLLRPEGATSKEILDSIGWKRISIPYYARHYGLRLRTTQQDGKSRYFGERRKIIIRARNRYEVEVDAVLRGLVPGTMPAIPDFLKRSLKVRP